MSTLAIWRKARTVQSTSARSSIFQQPGRTVRIRTGSRTPNSRGFAIECARRGEFTFLQ